MTASFLSLIFYYASTCIHEETPLFSIERDIMGADTVVLGWAILSVVIAVVYWICFWIAYGCKSKKQFQDEEQGDVVVNREENYESIFVNPPNSLYRLTLQLPFADLTILSFRLTSLLVLLRLPISQNTRHFDQIQRSHRVDEVSKPMISPASRLALWCG